VSDLVAYSGVLTFGGSASSWDFVLRNYRDALITTLRSVIASSIGQSSSFLKINELRTGSLVVSFTAAAQVGTSTTDWTAAAMIQRIVASNASISASITSFFQSYAVSSQSATMWSATSPDVAEESSSSLLVTIISTICVIVFVIAMITGCVCFVKNCCCSSQVSPEQGDAAGDGDENPTHGHQALPNACLVNPPQWQQQGLTPSQPPPSQQLVYPPQQQQNFLPQQYYLVDASPHPQQFGYPTLLQQHQQLRSPGQGQ
jgi:hypothetical protein